MVKMRQEVVVNAKKYWNSGDRHNSFGRDSSFRRKENPRISKGNRTSDQRV